MFCVTGSGQNGRSSNWSCYGTSQRFRTWHNGDGRARALTIIQRGMDGLVSHFAALVVGILLPFPSTGFGPFRLATSMMAVSTVFWFDRGLQCNFLRDNPRFFQSCCYIVFASQVSNKFYSLYQNKPYEYCTTNLLLSQPIYLECPQEPSRLLHSFYIRPQRRALPSSLHQWLQKDSFSIGSTWLNSSYISQIRQKNFKVYQAETTVGQKQQTRKH